MTCRKPWQAAALEIGSKYRSKLSSKKNVKKNVSFFSCRIFFFIFQQQFVRALVSVHTALLCAVTCSNNRAQRWRLVSKDTGDKKASQYGGRGASTSRRCRCLRDSRYEKLNESDILMIVNRRAKQTLIAFSLANRSYLFLLSLTREVKCWSFRRSSLVESRVLLVILDTECWSSWNHSAVLDAVVVGGVCRRDPREHVVTEYLAGKVEIRSRVKSCFHLVVIESYS